MMKRVATFLFLALAVVSVLVPVSTFAQGTGAGDPTLPGNDVQIYQPQLQVPIPGFQRDTIVIGDGDNGCQEGYICAFSIDAYLNAVYKWVASIAVLLAITLLMIGGVEYMIGSAAGSVDRAKGRMRNAAFGLILVFGTTAVLSFVNPDITKLGAVELPIIEAAEDISDAVLLGGVTDVSNNLVPPGITPQNGQVVAETDFGDVYLKHAGGVLIHPDIIGSLKNAASALFSRTNANYHMYVTSAYRSSDAQAVTWINSCMRDNRTGSFTCSKPVCYPWPRTNAGSPFDSDNHRSGPWTLKASINEQYPDDPSLLQYLRTEAVNNPMTYCPHLTGTTIDVWCGPRLGNYTDNVTCHMTLEEVLKASNFRRLDAEVWHFEHISKLSSASTINNSAVTGVQRMSASQCVTARHGEQCQFDYTTCRADQGGSDYANFKLGCCSDKAGICCDTAGADASVCGANAN